MERLDLQSILEYINDRRVMLWEKWCDSTGLMPRWNRFRGGGGTQTVEHLVGGGSLSSLYPDK